MDRIYLIPPDGSWAVFRVRGRDLIYQPFHNCVSLVELHVVGEQMAGLTGEGKGDADAYQIIWPRNMSQSASSPFCLGWYSRNTGPIEGGLDKVRGRPHASAFNSLTGLQL